MKIDGTISNVSDKPAELSISALLDTMRKLRNETAIKRIYFSKEYLEKLTKNMLLTSAEEQPAASRFMGIPFYLNDYLPEGVDAILQQADGKMILLTNEKYRPPPRPRNGLE